MLEKIKVYERQIGSIEADYGDLSRVIAVALDGHAGMIDEDDVEYEDTVSEFLTMLEEQLDKGYDGYETVLDYSELTPDEIDELHELLESVLLGTLDVHHDLAVLLDDAENGRYSIISIDVNPFTPSDTLGFFLNYASVCLEEDMEPDMYQATLMYLSVALKEVTYNNLVLQKNMQELVEENEFLRNQILNQNRDEAKKKVGNFYS